MGGGKILAHRHPISADRAKLRLVLETRAFAVDSLGLPARDAFTQFSQLDHDTLVLVLSGAWRDRLQPVTWWFPVVGRVPYRGYFDFAEAQRAERALAASGYDTYLRPSPAFSTLGFFNDPLLSTTLHEDSVDIANTVIHELTHNRFYASGQAVFNESFASFAGAKGGRQVSPVTRRYGARASRGGAVGPTICFSRRCGSVRTRHSIPPIAHIPERRRRIAATTP